MSDSQVKSPCTTDWRSASDSIMTRTSVRWSRSSGDTDTTRNPICGLDTTSPCSTKRGNTSRSTPVLVSYRCESSAKGSRAPGANRPARISDRKRWYTSSARVCEPLVTVSLNQNYPNVGNVFENMLTCRNCAERIESLEGQDGRSMRIATTDGRLNVWTSDGWVDVERRSDNRFSSDPQEIYPRWAEFRAWADRLELGTADALDDGGAEGARWGGHSPRQRQGFAHGASY